MALSIDRRALIDIISEGQGDIGGVMQPLPEGLWGIPEEVLKTLPGYDPDVQKNRGEAREIMRNLGYGSGVFLVSLAHARARLEKSKCDDRVAI
jgi:peptide/nickel transport system substrate-binding protein